MKTLAAAKVCYATLDRVTNKWVPCTAKQIKDTGEARKKEKELARVVAVERATARGMPVPEPARKRKNEDDKLVVERLRVIKSLIPHSLHFIITAHFIPIESRIYILYISRHSGNLRWL